ncbi:MAG: M20/M25/M40 family metallo-hydrolase, partial [Clostridia bacterium]|nr:M20/M25/M40 family metallo-hydrolase [Clostridia bacterium]
TTIAEKTIINNFSLIYKIEGSDKSLLPACFLAHQDVVPAPPEGWENDPFSGIIKDGYVYGRGSMDMKSQFITVMEAVETLLANNTLPKRTIYLCFGHDEEYPTLAGAPKIVEYFEKNGTRFEFVIDEGGLMLDGRLLGVDGTIALIGTCEKGHCDYTVRADIDGGHGSMPGNKSSLGEVMKASVKIMKRPLPSQWTSATEDMIDSLAPHTKFGFRVVFANRKLLAPLIKLVLDKASSITRSIVKTSFAPTMAKGSDAPNVIPGTASVNINVRNIPGQSLDYIKAYMQKIAGKNVKIIADSAGSDASPISPIDTYAFSELKKAIGQTFEGLIVAPFMFPAGTDSKYYYPVCDNVFRFTPFIYGEDDRTRVHARNERCKVADLAKAAQFFGALITNTCY